LGRDGTTAAWTRASARAQPTRAQTRAQRVDARFAARLVSTFVQPERIKVIAVALAVGAFALGCSSSPAPQPATPPPGGERPPTPESGFTGSGAEDSAAALLGSTGALYRFRFKQLQPPAERFNFQDRDL